jgi:glutamine---fructose-6-phosphate transaminase (isomerizing)
VNDRHGAGSLGQPAEATTGSAATRSFHDDVLRQPENLERAGATFLGALGEADLGRFGVDPLVFIGMGASYFSVIPAVSELRAARRPALAIPATEILEPGGDRVGSAYVGVSQSGRSAETVAAFRAVDTPRLALTTSGSGPLAQVADLTLPIGSEADAGVSVLTYSASLFAGAALASVLGARAIGIGIGRLAELVGDLLGEAEPVAERVAARLAGTRAIDAVGTGYSSASAGYAALVIRETARIPAAAFDTGQYLHGPVEVAEPGIGAVLFGSGREVRLASNLASYGTTVLLVTTSGEGRGGDVDVIRLPEVPPVLRPILEAVPIQLLAGQLARARGLSPGSFRRHQDDTKLEAP